MSDQEIHICSLCYEVNHGFRYERNGQKKCLDCNGVVLNLQEAADTIAMLKEELRKMQERYGEEGC